MKVLVTFAIEREFAPWRKLRHFQHVPADAWDRTYRARVGEADVRVIVTGAGRSAVQGAARRAFDDVPDVCIASGLCGALQPVHPPGAVLAARSVADIKGANLVRSDEDLISHAAEGGAKVVAKLLTADKVISTAAEKISLEDAGDAVDMESLYVFEAASRQGIRSVAIRAVSDGPELDLPLDFNRAFNRRGRVSMPKILGQLAARPHRIGRLLRLTRESDRAARALADFLDRFVQQVVLRENGAAEALAI